MNGMYFFITPSKKKAIKSGLDFYYYKRLPLSLAFETPNSVFENVVKILFLTVALF